MILFKNIIILFFTILLVYSCKKPIPEPEKPIDENQNKPKEDTVEVVKPIPKYFEENSWIYKTMKENYLWENKMPKEEDTDKNLEPLAYFNTLTNSPTHEDWVSYMSMDKQEIFDFWGGHMISFGFKFRKEKKEDGSIQLAVSLVFKESPAQKGNLWRGDVIVKINGSVINENNLESLLNSPVGTFECLDTDGNLKTLNLTKEKFQINPFEVAHTIELGNKKIGYFCFTQFLPNIDDQLRTVFNKFKNDKVDEFVLDLRFNPGGFTPNTEVFISHFVNSPSPDAKMYYTKWNTNRTDFYQKAEGPTAGIRKFTQETGNLGHLKRLFVLTSKSSASSSEMVINCLRPFMEVIVIGDNTYGKNLISNIFTDETGKFPYALMPAYTYMFNIKDESDYGTKLGFKPDHKIEDNILPFYPLGNVNETLLKKAVEIIAQRNIARNPEIPFREVNFADRFHHHDTGKAFNTKINP